MEATPFGVGILKHSFFYKDILNLDDIHKAYAYFDQHLKLPGEFFSGRTFDSLAGASGTFETIEILLFGKSDYNEKICLINLSDFQKLYNDLVFSDSAFRMAYPRMPKERTNLMPAGLVLIDYMLKLLKAKNIQVTKYALKEGVASELSEI